MYIYKNLNNVSYSEITQCFNLAFSDYILPMQLTEEQLISIFAGSGVDRNISFGAFKDNQMVGFIFNSCNIYNGNKVVFDVGTGVVPKHRGNKIFSNLYRYTEQQLQSCGIEKYYLEVLQENDKAIALYRKHGFDISRELTCLIATNSVNETTAGTEIEWMDLTGFDFDQIQHCINVEPSYEHSTNVLKTNLGLYGIGYTLNNNKISAYCIFSKQRGSIVQLGYEDTNDLKSIIEQLLNRHSNISMKNIDSKNGELISLLKSIGFSELTKQFEMVKSFA